MPSYTLTGAPTQVDNLASSSIAVTNTGTVPILAQPLGRQILPSASVTLPSWSAVPTTLQTAGPAGSADVTLTAGSPATRPGPGAVTLDAGGLGPMSVTITGGSWFTNEGLTAAASFPLTVATSTVVYPAAPASVTISGTAGGVTKTLGLNVVNGCDEVFRFAELLGSTADTVRAGVSGVGAGAFVRPLGTGVLYIGDSITSDQDDTRGTVNWPTPFEYLSMGAVHRVHNAAVAGWTSAQVLADLPAQLATYGDKTDIVICMVGSNDGQLASFATNYPQIVSLVRAAGKRLYTCTIPPHDSTPGGYQDQINAWLSAYTRRHALDLIDAHAALVDPATGNYLSGYSSDGTHPAPAGQYAIAQAVWTAVSSQISLWTPKLVAGDPDGSNLMTGGLFLRASNDSWTSVTGTGGAIAAVTQSGVPGKMMQITQTAATGSSYVRSPTVTTGLVVGHRYLFAARFQTSGTIAGSCNVFINPEILGSSTLFLGPQGNSPMDIPDGVIYHEVVAPAGSTGIRWEVGLRNGTGVLRLGQVTVRDLTTLSANTDVL